MVSFITKQVHAGYGTFRRSWNNPDRGKREVGKELGMTSGVWGKDGVGDERRGTLRLERSSRWMRVRSLDLSWD